MGRIGLRIIVLLSISLNLAFLIAHCPWCSKSGTPAPVMQLSAAQVDQLQAVRQQHQPRYDELSSSLEKKQIQLLNLLKQTEVDRTAVDRCISEINGLQSEMQNLAISEILQCKPLLSHKQCNCMLDESAMRMGFCIREGTVCCKKNKKSL